MKYTLGEIAKITKGKLFGNNDVIITSVITDSRKISVDENSIFIALSGKNHDGHDFLENVYNTHTKNFLVNKLPENFEASFPGANFIVVEDTLKAFQQWAAYHRSNFNYPVVGITGSNGKTIVKEWLYQALRTDHNIIRSPKSYNSQIGVPLSVFLMDYSHDFAIFEAGISQEKEMAPLAEIINPTIGIITNIGDAHQENFPDLRTKLNEKLKLFVNSDVIIYNKDYQLIDDTLSSLKIFDEKTLFTWSTKFTADVTVKKREIKGNYTEITVAFNNKTFIVQIPFTDYASFENAMHIIALMLHLGYNSGTIAERLKNLSPIAIRLELKEAVNNCSIINDYYNSDINSISIALDFLSTQNQHPVKTLILSDVLQSGKDEFSLYKEIAGMVNKKGVDKFIGIGKVISQYENLFTTEKYFFGSTKKFLENLHKFKFHNEAILLKGARRFRFEDISKAFQKKTHETVLQINLSAITHNLNYFRSKLPKNTKIMVMVKAFSYGNGNYEIANLLQYHKVDYLGVAFADEGISLRKAGIYLPIMVMNPEPSTYEEIIENNLEPEIYSFEVLENFYNEVIRQRLVEYPIHIKLNTGMNRLGFNPEEIETLISILNKHPEVKVKSVFSHLASSDDPADDEFTETQIQLFSSLAAEIEKGLNKKLIKHILNSHGILRFPQYAFDMVRLGIGLYGFSEINQEDLENVSTLKTRILQIRNITPPASVGYNRKGKISKPSQIAIIPIGYAHGYSRMFGNGRGEMLVKGKKVPTVGNINMDMTAIDVTGIDVKPGDEVIVFGKGHTAAELAKEIGTIPYEIITSISPRVKRIYYYE